jgi:hypothetical protein
LAILIESRGFSDEHNSGVWIPNTENNLGPP